MTLDETVRELERLMARVKSAPTFVEEKSAFVRLKLASAKALPSLLSALRERTEALRKIAGCPCQTGLRACGCVTCAARRALGGEHG